MNRTEWVMHVWGKKRDKLELTDVEKFHIDMLKMFQDQHKRFDRIIVNFAMDDIQDLNLYHFLKSKIQRLSRIKMLNSGLVKMTRTRESISPSDHMCLTGLERM